MFVFSFLNVLNCYTVGISSMANAGGGSGHVAAKCLAVSSSPAGDVCSSGIAGSGVDCSAARR